MRAWQVRDEPYSKGLAELMNYQHRLPCAQHWDAGTPRPRTASSIQSEVLASTPARSIYGIAQSPSSSARPPDVLIISMTAAAARRLACSVPCIRAPMRNWYSGAIFVMWSG
jgi:hypothetical protein